MSKPTVALMGLGLMGSGMARNLLAAGFPLTVYNRTPGKAAPLADAGARVASSPRDAAAGAEIVISMVSDDAASRAVWLGDDGALAGAEAGALFIESSTVTVEWVRELAGRVAERGFELLDAPVTGSKPQAAEGQLLFLVGGSEHALEHARPVLSVMSRDIVHMGPTGSGALIKLVNNFLCGVQAASLAEALALIDASRLDRGRALEILTGGAPGSPMVKTLADRMSAGDFSTRFALRLMLKDLDYAYGEGARHAVPLRMAASARDVFEGAVEAGYGEKDLSAVVEQFRER
jgi:3-hydroxyisobutyrate dehydrogenase